MSNYALWFLDNGIGVFSLKVRGNTEPYARRRERKEPAVANNLNYTCSTREAKMLVSYGVILGDLLVVDTDSVRTEEVAASFLPLTPFMVSTGPYHDGGVGRGRHRYYRSAGRRSGHIYHDGQVFESRNVGSYVCGPGSVHPSNCAYVPDRWSWRLDEIPYLPDTFVFDDGSVTGSVGDFDPLNPPTVIIQSRRHELLFAWLRSMRQNKATSKEEVRALILEINENCCQPPIMWGEHGEEEFDRWFERAYRLKDQPLIPTLTFY